MTIAVTPATFRMTQPPSCGLVGSGEAGVRIVRLCEGEYCGV
jgi:hypothetical protein